MDKCIQDLEFALEMMNSFFDTYVAYDPERENIVTLHDAMEIIEKVKNKLKQIN